MQSKTITYHEERISAGGMLRPSHIHLLDDEHGIKLVRACTLHREVRARTSDLAISSRLHLGGVGSVMVGQAPSAKPGFRIRVVSGLSVPIAVCNTDLQRVVHVDVDGVRIEPISCKPHVHETVLHLLHVSLKLLTSSFKPIGCLPEERRLRFIEIHN